ncbi:MULTISPECIES: RNA polymerase sigma factor ShbA [Micromonospora]|uniref:RNA polymerase sigma factor ShbA n=1 Tax=Micromonospora sicca TaxID=2202420 RepID=A0A317DEG7_9ACTN|nr:MULTISPECIES: RNA polymerase sigma factor ShbA [unclassified Micromonospora]MBM0227780.1 RNA polymerase sigma factor ShbA [Micromonospora sp. ATA51]MDZ5444893.1 RNA polymerase sigma factor ShbA [Micromonospora sp. 4G57]MDZ5487947.1 RNA polymerase sigma factor ShbA [Micromonospora sp. 4G53]PWR13209.1 RNA polymerase sigma factor ShbA [Micromonospora sp. 4G51]
MIRAVDPELVRQAVQGDRRAMAELLTDVRPGLVRYCRARLGRVGGAYTTADDVAQEVCVAVLRALPGYRDQGSPFAAFVYGIAAHKVADAQRAAIRDSAVTPIDAPLEQPDAAPGPEQQAVATDLARRLSVLLKKLPEAQREIILLRVAVGLPADEVGLIVGMTAAAVRVAQSRALARLRTLAGDALDEVAA